MGVNKSLLGVTGKLRNPIAHQLENPFSGRGIKRLLVDLEPDQMLKWALHISHVHRLKARLRERGGCTPDGASEGHGLEATAFDRHKIRGNVIKLASGRPIRLSPSLASRAAHPAF
jgi:hypothetical protein